MDFGFLVISSVFYVVLYGPRCWVNKRSLLSEFRHSAFVYLSVCCFERLLEGPLLSFLLFVLLCCLSLYVVCRLRLRMLPRLFKPYWEGSWRAFV